MRSILLLVLSFSAFFAADIPGFKEELAKHDEAVKSLKKELNAKCKAYLMRLDLTPVPPIADPKKSQELEAADITNLNGTLEHARKMIDGPQLASMSWIYAVENIARMADVYEKYKGKLPAFNGAGVQQVKAGDDAPKKERKKITAITSDGKVVEQ